MTDLGTLSHRALGQLEKPPKKIINDQKKEKKKGKM